jgi:hypothetical protein
MKHIKLPIELFITSFVTTTLILFLSFATADAAPIILQSTNQFCDVRSVNDVGFGVGRFVTVTADLTPDGDLTDASGNGPPDGFADSDDVSPPSVVIASQDGQNPVLNYFPLPNSPNHFARSRGFDCDNPTFPDLRDSWTISISNGSDTCIGGSCTLNGNVVINPVTPDVQGVQNLPFVASFIFQATGDPTKPIFNWTVPPDTAHDQVTIWIQDREDFIGQGGVGGGGAARVIFSRRLADDATSFDAAEIPAGVLKPDRKYSVSFQLDQLRPLPADPRFGRLQSRARAFFSFETRPLPINQQVYLPTVDPDGVGPGQPVYHFTVFDVQPAQVIFIDPPIAVGYDYQIGVGDPNFESVLLPEVGDNVFDIYLWNGSKYVFHASIGAGLEYKFPPGGVDRFRVLGIESSEGVDPNDVMAFITGLTFMSSGQFTGTMTPIIAEALCSILGDDPKPSLLDQDIYTMQGAQGEDLRVRLEDLKSDSNKRASLILLDNMRGVNLLKTDNGTLPNQVGAVLPATGEYLVVVGEQPLIARGNRFRGDYCVSVQSSAGAAQTLQPTGWVE